MPIHPRSGDCDTTLPGVESFLSRPRGLGDAVGDAPAAGLAVARRVARGVAVLVALVVEPRAFFAGETFWTLEAP